MIRQTTDKGTISVSSHVYTKIAGIAATNCFGVKGMAFRSMTDGLVQGGHEQGRLCDLRERRFDFH